MAQPDVKIRLTADDKTRSAFASASSNLQKLQAGALKLNSAFGALGAAISIGAIAAFAKSGIDAADALNDMSKRLGVSVKDLASFKLAAEQSGTSLDGVGKGIARLTRSIGEAEGGNKKLAAALGTLGITARDPKEAFFQLADAVQRIQDPSQRAALLNQVLGKSYQELVPLLNEGGDALRQSAKASESFAESMAKLAPDADRFNDQLAALKINAAGAAGVLLVKLVPALNEIFERITLVKSLIGAGGLFGTLNITAGTSEISTVMRRLRDDIKATQSAIEVERGKGKDTTGFEEKLRGLNAQLVVMKENSRSAALALGEQFKNYKVPQTPSGAPGKIKTPSDSFSKAKGGAKSDPLSGLLGQTDIGKLAAFDKQVALLNARFDGGRKSTELYNQAMTKLVETTFSANFSEFTRQMAEQGETQRLVAEHLKATNDDLFNQQQAWIEVGRALEEEMRTPLENANIEFARLQDLLDRGVVSWETYARAVFKTSEAIETAGEKVQEMDVFAKTAAKGIQGEFANMFKNFDQGTDGMAKRFGEMLKNMIAEAAAAQLARQLFGELTEGGSGEGWIGGALKLFGSFFADGGIAAYGKPVALPRFAGGGVSNSAAIFGEAGPEAAVPLPDGRSIPVTMKGGGGHTVNVYVSGNNNAPDVRRAAGQGAREALGLLNGARRYG